VDRHDDPRPGGPIEDLNFLRVLWTGGAQPEADERDYLRATLLARFPPGRVVRRLC
jgi:hypothetical protein